MIATDHTLYAAGTNGIHALDPSTGNRRATVYSTDDVATADVDATDLTVRDMALVGGSTLIAIFASEESSHVATVDIDTGTTLWSRNWNDLQGILAATRESLLTTREGATAFEVGSGSKSWSADLYNFPTYKGTRIFGIGGGAAKTRAYTVTESGPTTDWTFKGEQERLNPLAVGNGYVAVDSTGPTGGTGSDGDNLYVLDEASGSLEWCQYLGKGVRSPPAIAGDAVYVGKEGSIHAFDLASGDPLWRYSLPSEYSLNVDVVPLDGGLVYVADREIGALAPA